MAARFDKIQKEAAMAADILIRQEQTHICKTERLVFGEGTVEHCAGCGESVRCNNAGRVVGYVPPRRASERESD